MIEEKDDVLETIQINDKDFFLRDLVAIANLGKISFGITLNVGGFLVSGTLVGGKEYYEGFAADFASGFSDPETAKMMQEAFSKRGKIYSSEKNRPEPNHIHIKEARFFNTNGNPIPGNRGVWWRGRLSQVDGFSLGALSAGDPA